MSGYTGPVLETTRAVNAEAEKAKAEGRPVFITHSDWMIWKREVEGPPTEIPPDTAHSTKEALRVSMHAVLVDQLATIVEWLK